jgi:hypothetical protein
VEANRHSISGTAAAVGIGVLGETVRRWCAAGEVNAEKDSSGRWQVTVDAAFYARVERAWKAKGVLGVKVPPPLPRYLRYYGKFPACASQCSEVGLIYRQVARTLGSQMRRTS